MKILHLRNSDLFGSPERLIIGQVKHLPEIDFICASYVRKGHSNDFLDECHAEGIRTATIHERFTGDWRPVGQIKDLLRGEGIDVIITHDYKSNLFGHLAARTVPARHLAHFHGITSEDLKVRLYNFIDRHVLKRISRVITVSNQTADRLTGMGIPEQNIIVVPNAVPSSIIRDSSERVDHDHIKIVAAGRFSYEKGFDLLLQAAARINPSATAFRIYIYGKGPELERLQALTGKLGLEERVIWSGFVADILPIFDDMDFLVLSSRSEGMPVIILEAWARQLGVMAAAVGGVPELIDDQKTGLLIEPESVDDLADKLLYGIEHPDEMHRYGRAGAELLKNHYTFEQQVKKLEEIYGNEAESTRRGQESGRGG